MLPGIYTGSAYLRQLGRLLINAELIQSSPAGEREGWFIYYHRTAPVFERFFSASSKDGWDGRKISIEGPVKRALQPSKNVRAAPAKPQAGPPTAEDVSRWTSLEEDTRLNEGPRRRQIHELLATTGLVRPEKVTRPIYKDVLHADLDDPYLGLGEALFTNYPFAKEDALSSP
jgi:hypothetical protein